MNRILSIATLSVIACLFTIASAAAQSKDGKQIGRFQLSVNYDGTMFLLDTTTGQCWTKARRGEWVDAGNPAKPRAMAKPAVEPVTTPVRLVLPKDKTELTIKQRQSKAIPGSKGRVLIHVDDITGGQALISIRDDSGAALVNEVSGRPGSILKFTVSKRQYYLRVKSLRNFLIGEDFAVLEVASNRNVWKGTRLRVPENGSPETPRPIKRSSDDAPPKPKSSRDS